MKYVLLMVFVLGGLAVESSASVPPVIMNAPDGSFYPCPSSDTIRVSKNEDKYYPNSNWTWLSTQSIADWGSTKNSAESGRYPGKLVSSRAEDIGSIIGMNYLCIYNAYADSAKTQPVTTKRLVKDIGANHGYIFYEYYDDPIYICKAAISATGQIGFSCPYP